MAKQTVHLTEETDRWRFTCPRGHRTWEPTNHHFWCQQCAAAAAVDPSFTHLRDRESGELLARDELALVTEAGPFDADLDRRRSA